MRFLLIAIVSVSLGGCASLQKLSQDISIATSSITNPIDTSRLNETENFIRVAFAGLNAWKQSCAQRLIPPPCRTQIAQVQVYTRQIPLYLTQLREFVKNNDQVNATVVFNQLMALYNQVKTQAAASGQNLGS